MRFRIHIEFPRIILPRVLKKIYILNFCVCLRVPACMYSITYMPASHGGQKKFVSTWRSKEVCPLELELQGLKSHHLGAASQMCHLQKQQVLLSMEPSLQPSLCDILTVMNC